MNGGRGIDRIKFSLRAWGMVISMPSEHGCRGRGTEGRGDHNLLPLEHVGREMQDKRGWDREAVCLSPLNYNGLLATLSNNPCFSTGTNYLVYIYGLLDNPSSQMMCCPCYNNFEVD